MKIKFSITPCPNDVFSYAALLDNTIENDFEFEFADIEKLNEKALLKESVFTKISFALYSKIKDDYELLNVGAALGRGTGPILVSSKNKVDFSSEKILVPGEHTTANLLLKFFAGKNVKTVNAYFRDIIEEIKSDKINAGVLIHEGRFVYESYGLNLIADLGAHWEKTTSLPVPLGCIVLRKDFLHLKDTIENQMQKSIKYAFENSKKCIAKTKEYAQYLSDDVLEKHIYAFVNDYSFDISFIRDFLLKNLDSML